MSTSDESELAVRQAPDELPRRKIAVVTLASLVVTSAALVVAWWLLAAWAPTPSRTRPRVAPQTIGGLEQSLILHTERGIALRRQQAATLERSEWIDRDAGLARIPIETAIDILVASPLPPERSIAASADHDPREGGP